MGGFSSFFYRIPAMLLRAPLARPFWLLLRNHFFADTSSMSPWIFDTKFIAKDDR
jgi:hypothetical protein